MRDYGFRPYVPVAERRAKALKESQKAKKAGKALSPVLVEGRKIAKTVWGQAWCDNLEAYSDYSNRLPRGRSYVRNGSIIDLAIEPGMVRAQVMGSSLYRIEIAVASASKERWSRLVAGVTGSVASLVELLQGKLSKGVMEKICHPESGLFPSPKEITLSCSCPDWASMCKHVAAALYGVGARLDSAPELLFTLRNVAASDLIAEAAKASSGTKKAPAKGRALEMEGLDDLFGIELEKETEEDVSAPRRKPGRPSVGTVAKASKKTTSPKIPASTSSLPEKKRPAVKETAAKAKATARSAGKTAPSSPPASKKIAPTAPKVKTAGKASQSTESGKRPGASKKKVSPATVPSRKKAAPTLATTQSAQGAALKRKPGRPPGRSSTTRTSPGKKAT